MAFLVSPGVHVREFDASTSTPVLGTSTGAIAGPFERGPVSSVVNISSEEELVEVFGKPQGDNFEWWFSAANFLQYSNALKVVRAESAVVNAVASGTAILIRDNDHYEASYAAGEASVGEWAARTAGTWGNSLRVSVCATSTAYEENLGSSNQTVGEDAAGATVVKVDDGSAFNVGDLISFSSADASSDATAFAFNTGDEGNEYEITGISSHDLTVRLKDDPNGSGVKATVPDNSFIRRRWRFYDLFDAAPGTSQWATDNGRGAGDEMHIVVYDGTGDITGADNDVAGQRQTSVIERYQGLSKNPKAKTAQGGSNYYPDVIFRQSEYVYWMDHNSSGSNWGTDTTSTYTAVDAPAVSTLASGTDDYAVTAGELEDAYDIYDDKELHTIDLVIGGPSSGVTNSAAGQDTHVTMITDLVEKRKDCVGFVSPYRGATVNVTSRITQAKNVKDAFDLCPSSSYMVYDSGYKYMFDKYNDVFRYVPLNGDIAGLCAETDKVAATWYSPAGTARGAVRGAIKLSFNPSQSQRDTLYGARINPVVNFRGEGVVLFGDKTALNKQSAFNRINVRRLFLHVERTIEEAARASLFEFNDEYTRNSFKKLVEPFLRDVQSGRGIDDFSVKCDRENNTDVVINNNEFRGDIYIRPAYSINFINLTFTAVRNGVSFAEVGG